MTRVHNLMPHKRPKLRECLCIYFAANVDEELTVQEVLVKFDSTNRNFATQLLTRMTSDGLLTMRHERNARGWGAPQRVYRAGPALLALIGLA